MAVSGHLHDPAVSPPATASGGRWSTSRCFREERYCSLWRESNRTSSDVQPVAQSP